MFFELKVALKQVIVKQAIDKQFIGWPALSLFHESIPYTTIFTWLDQTF